MLSIQKCRFDWQSVHFGFPKSAGFYTSGVSNQYLRVFRSNPSEMLPEEAIDISFGVPIDLKPRVMNILRSDLGSRDFPDHMLNL
jgi:hypothetical protein